MGSLMTFRDGEKVSRLLAKRRQLDLMHRVLRVIVKQETTRKLGFAFQVMIRDLTMLLSGQLKSRMYNQSKCFCTCSMRKKRLQEN